MVAEITRLSQLVAQLQKGNASNSGNTGGAKMKKPEPYDGTKDTLRGFLTQLRAYMRHYEGEFIYDHQKVMFAANQLTGSAISWFEPILRDYLENDEPKKREKETRRIFEDYDNFEEAIKAAFGDPDEERTAERQLTLLKQKGPASEYAAKFRQLSSKLDWPDEPLMTQFYAGLKEEVKDELAKQDRPDEFADFVKMAVRIDNRLYERRLEKRSRGAWTTTKSYTSNTKKKVQYQGKPRSTAWGSHSGPMEIDTTKRQPKKGTERKDIKCYNCQEKGHYANECKKPKRLPEPKRQLNATQKPPHQNLSWTACYDDTCSTHKSDKEVAGWYPKERNSKTIAMLKRVELGKALRALDNWEKQEPDTQTQPALEWHEQDCAQEILDSQEPARDIKEETPEPEIARPTVIVSTLEAGPSKYDPTSYLGTRQYPAPYGDATRAILSGVPMRMAHEERRANQQPRPMFGDDETLEPQHLTHGQVAWAVCIYDHCGKHMGQKVTNNFFPRRHNNQPIPDAMQGKELEHWIITERGTVVPYVVFTPDPEYPLDCRELEDWRSCRTPKCLTHAVDKALAWHGIQQINRPAEQRRRRQADERLPGMSPQEYLEGVAWQAVQETQGSNSEESVSQVLDTIKRAAERGTTRQENQTISLTDLYGNAYRRYKDEQEILQQRRTGDSTLRTPEPRHPERARQRREDRLRRAEERMEQTLRYHGWTKNDRTQL